jgi:hypothetical protein
MDKKTYSFINIFVDVVRLHDEIFVFRTFQKFLPRAVVAEANSIFLKICEESPIQFHLIIDCLTLFIQGMVKKLPHLCLTPYCSQR